MKKKLLGLLTVALVAAPAMQAKWYAVNYFLTNKTGVPIKVYTKDDPIHTTQASAVLLKEGEQKKFWHHYKNDGAILGPIRFYYSPVKPNGETIAKPGEKFYHYKGARFSSPQRGRKVGGIGMAGVGWTNRVSGTIVLGDQVDSDGDKIPKLIQTWPLQPRVGKFAYPAVSFAVFRAPTATATETKVQTVTDKNF